MLNNRKNASAFETLTMRSGVPPWRWSASWSVWTGSFQETSLWSWQPVKGHNSVHSPIDLSSQRVELTEKIAALTSKQSPKSMWRIFPLSRSNIRLEGCLEQKNFALILDNSLVKMGLLGRSLTCLPAPGCSPPWTWRPGSGCNWSFCQTTPADKKSVTYPQRSETGSAKSSSQVGTGRLTSELGLFSHSSLARSSPAVLLTACSNTSTFSIRVRWS